MNEIKTLADFRGSVRAVNGMRNYFGLPTAEITPQMAAKVPPIEWGRYPNCARRTVMDILCFARGLHADEVSLEEKQAMYRSILSQRARPVGRTAQEASELIKALQRDIEDLKRSNANLRAKWQATHSDTGARLVAVDVVHPVDPWANIANR